MRQTTGFHFDIVRLDNDEDDCAAQFEQRVVLENCDVGPRLQRKAAPLLLLLGDHAPQSADAAGD